MKDIARKFILAAIIAAVGAPVYAVSDKEMEKARTITAQAYLRYANDASGYLDEIQAESVEQLKGKLKPKEAENLKSFMAVAVPRDYASWDKKQLIEYWSTTFFASPGLIEKGCNSGAKSRVRRKIEAMTVTPPSEAQPAQPETAAAPAPAPAADSAVMSAEAAALSDSLELAKQKLDDALADEALESKRENSHTWVYVAILAVLVGVVIWLVVFASNVMRRKKDSDEESDYSRPEGAREDDGDNEAIAAEASAMREKFASTLAAKNEELRQLNKRVEALQHDYESIQQDDLSLRAEADDWRRRAEDLQRRIDDMSRRESAVAQEAAAAARAAAERRPETPRREPLPSAAPVRSIFLGRANARGLFVRADRNLNIGHSIFRLDTSDGYAGTFRVANDPTVWEMALLTPRESLAGACVAPDLNATAGMSRIVTVVPGTAIFEDGCWKVIRKAKIAYE